MHMKWCEFTQAVELRLNGIRFSTSISMVFVHRKGNLFNCVVILKNRFMCYFTLIRYDGSALRTSTNDGLGHIEKPTRSDLHTRRLLKLTLSRRII